MRLIASPQLGFVRHAFISPPRGRNMAWRTNPNGRFTGRLCALWTTPDPKRLKLLKKNANIFLSPLDFELTQKLSQDVRCCVHNCSLVLVCMYVCLFVFCSLFKLKRTLGAGGGGQCLYYSLKTVGVHIIFNNNYRPQNQKLLQMAEVARTLFQIAKSSRATCG